MQEVLHVNGVDIWYEDFGRSKDPAVLLIMGTGEPGISWSDALCHGLAAEGRRVIRYDHRDTGKSGYFDYDEEPYDLSDMARDAVGLLDALRVPAAHIVGASMGGMIAQEIAIQCPRRVLTLTCLISSPTVNDPENPAAFVSGLPPMDIARLGPVFMVLAENPPTTDAEQIEASLSLARATSGSRGFLDEKAFRQVMERSLAHRTRPADPQNHSRAISASRDRTELLKAVSAPTLVVHGTEDPLFPYQHGVAISECVPGARLLTIEGMGHELPPPADLVNIIRSQLARG